MHLPITQTEGSPIEHQRKDSVAGATELEKADAPSRDEGVTLTESTASKVAEGNAGDGDGDDDGDDDNSSLSSAPDSIRSWSNESVLECLRTGKKPLKEKGK